MQELNIYIADLGAYNAGKLNGFWYELGSVSNEELQEKINAMLKGGEEWAIHDYELPFKVGEYQNVFKLNEWAEEFFTLNKSEKIIQLVYIDQYGFNAEIEYNLDGLVLPGDAAELGHWIADTHEISGDMKKYVDYEQIGRDQYVNGWFEFEYEGEPYQIRLEV